MNSDDPSVETLDARLTTEPTSAPSAEQFLDGSKPMVTAEGAARREAAEHHALKHAYDRLQERLAKKTVKYHALKESHDRLRQEFVDLKSSYYLSGAHKNLDIRELVPFGEIAQTVIAEGRTGMDYDRLYTLWEAVCAAPPDVPVIEIGSYKGGSARFIAESLRRAGCSPRFFVCDTFQGHPRVDPDIDLAHKKAHSFLDTSVDEVRAYLRDYPHVEVVEGDIHVTAERFSATTVWGFVHLDVDVYPPTDFCLRFFGPKLAAGAWLVVDDYASRSCPGVKRALDEFIAARPQFRMLHLLTGQAVVYRVP